MKKILIVGLFLLSGAVFASQSVFTTTALGMFDREIKQRQGHVETQLIETEEGTYRVFTITSTQGVGITAIKVE